MLENIIKKFSAFYLEMITQHQSDIRH